MIGREKRRKTGRDKEKKQERGRERRKRTGRDGEGRQWQKRQ